MSVKILVRPSSVGDRELVFLLQPLKRKLRLPVLTPACTPALSFFCGSSSYLVAAESGLFPGLWWPAGNGKFWHTGHGRWEAPGSHCGGHLWAILPRTLSWALRQHLLRRKQVPRHGETHVWICHLAQCLMLFISEWNHWIESGVFPFTSHRYIFSYFPSG